MKVDRVIQAKVNSSQPFYDSITTIRESGIMPASTAWRCIYRIFFDSLVNQFGWTRALTSGDFSLPTILEGIRGH